MSETSTYAIVVEPLSAEDGGGWVARRLGGASPLAAAVGRADI
jgi:hypothetical protein